MTKRACGLLCVAVASIATAPAYGESSYSVSATPLYIGDAGLENGGKVRLQSMSGNVGGRWDLNEVSNIGVQINYAHDDWEFTDRAAPWKNVARYGISVPFMMALSPEWRLSVTPNVGVAAETGADSSDAVLGGVSAGAFKVFGKDKLIGAGLAVFSNLDQVRAFPYFIVSWKFDEHWRLANPLAVGPTGPGGLELSYDSGKGWDLGVGGAYRSSRFRLNENNVGAPKGVGEFSTLPVFFRAGYDAKVWRLDGYLGASVLGSLKTENANGDDVLKEDLDPALLAGVTLSIDF
ncbi:DUF6268 family outer membrane beta-barrel protein [Niveibacterium sp. SC-1]|uniref:DUF6268 family outer membrane beta-barrel protein n=1 Tax=Niveibacterium sp. SC-1 TaxID=3135646 RepID=UPI0031200F16